MKNNILEIKEKGSVELSNIVTLQELEEYRVKYMGKKGVVTEISKQMKDLTPEERPVVGQLINDLRDYITNLVEEKKIVLEKDNLEKRLIEEIVDITLPGEKIETGIQHPITQTIDLVKGVFANMGFDIAEGPEIEEIKLNFDMLNIPEAHPSRAETDTFYIDDNMLLRTQTSPMQIRYMMENKPPFRMICPGKVYRPDYDVTHTPMFHQIEGLVVGENISFADLKGILIKFIEEIFDGAEARFRPHFFPFTEPSAEVDIKCNSCKGKGCRICKQSTWLEIMGCGMVHPKVLKAVGYDPNVVTGFAFGMGVERITMLKYGIDDLRAFFENDIRFLKQF